MDEKEKEVKEADEKREDVDSCSFKEEVETESSSFVDEYIEHEPIGLEKLLEGKDVSFLSLNHLYLILISGQFINEILIASLYDPVCYAS